MRRGAAASISSSVRMCFHSVTTSLYAGSPAAEPCARGHSFGTGARCDPRAARPEQGRASACTGGYAPCETCPTELTRTLGRDEEQVPFGKRIAYDSTEKTSEGHADERR